MDNSYPKSFQVIFEKIIPENNCWRIYLVENYRGLFEQGLRRSWGRIGQKRLRSTYSVTIDEEEAFRAAICHSRNRINRGYRIVECRCEEKSFGGYGRFDFFSSWINQDSAK